MLLQKRKDVASVKGKRAKMHKSLKKFLPGLKSNLLRFGLKRLRKVVEACLAGPECLKEVYWWSCIDYSIDDSDRRFRLILTKEGDILRLFHLFICADRNVVISEIQMEMCGEDIVSKSKLTSHGDYWKKIKELGHPY